MKKKSGFFLLAGLLALSLLFVAGCGRDRSDSSSGVLRVGLIPNQAPDKIKARYEPFRAYLSKKTGMDVELFVAADYTGVVEAMAGDKLELAYFGGLTYVQARKRADIYPIVTEIDRYTKTTKYSSLIIVPADSPITSLSQLKGKTFAFGDVSSTSGSLYPRIMLDRAGIKVPGDLKNMVYTGSHDATALAVQNNTVDAGGVEGRILKKMIDKGTVDQSRIRVLLESDPIEGYPWVVRGKLDKPLVERIVQAFLEINDPALLDLMRAERYEKIDAGSYDYVEMEASRLGLLKN